MKDAPQWVKDFNFDGPNVFEAPTCRESERNYIKLLSRGGFLPNGLLYGFTGLIIGKVVAELPVTDRFNFEDPSNFSSLTILKNPFSNNDVEKTETLGVNSALVSTRKWLYLARVRGESLEVTRPVRDNYYDQLRQLHEKALEDVQPNLVGLSIWGNLAAFNSSRIS